jgi:hypothetical protein
MEIQVRRGKHLAERWRALPDGVYTNDFQNERCTLPGIKTCVRSPMTDTLPGIWVRPLVSEWHTTRVYG